MNVKQGLRQYYSLNIVAVSVIAPIIRQAFERVAINDYVKVNLNSSTLNSCDAIVKNLVRQAYFKPTDSRIIEDYEPEALGEDNMMPVTAVQQAEVKGKPSIPSISELSKRHASRKSAISHSQMSEHKTDKKLRVVDQNKKCELLPAQGLAVPQQEKDIVRIYRFKKQEQQRLRLLPPMVRVKNNVARLGRGEKMFFDFEGNVGKVKETGSGAFKTVVVDSEVQKKSRVVQKRDWLRDANMEDTKITIANKISDKLGSKKSGRFGGQAEQVDFSKGMDSKELGANIKMEVGTRIMIAGQVLQGEKVSKKQGIGREWTSMPRRMEQRKLNDKQQPAKVAQIKDRLNTQFLQQQLAVSKVSESLRMSKSRAKTQVRSQQQSAKHGISINNESLKKQFLTEQDQVDFKHIEIPVRLGMLRQSAIKSSSLMESNKKEMSLNQKLGDKQLPNIFNYKLGNRELLRQIRKKLNF